MAPSDDELLPLGPEPEAEPAPGGLVSPPGALHAEGLAASFRGPLEAFLLNAVDSVHTRRAYRRHVKDAFYIMGVEAVTDVAAAHLVLYRGVLMEDGRGAASHAQALAGVRSFLNWCDVMGGLRMPARTMEALLRVPKVEVQRPFVTASAAEIEAFLEGASPRDKALVLVMAGGGLRVGEVEHLDCTDLREVDGGPILWVREGKGRKDRLVPIREEVKVAIHRYLLEDGRTESDPGPLFLAQDRGVEAATRQTQRLSDDGIRRVLRRLVLRAAVAKRITPHALRHTFGMAFQRHGKDMNLTAKVLGHKTLAPTMRYTDHLQLAELREHLPEWTED